MSAGQNLASMIIEGFICPECQQDMSSIEILHAHFELMHSNRKNQSPSSNHSSSSLNQSGQEKGTGHSLFAKAKTFISSSFEQGNSTNPFLESDSEAASTASSVPNTPTATVSTLFFKQWFNSNQQEGTFNTHTNYFKQVRDNIIGRQVVQTNKLLITLDKLVSIDLTSLNDDSKRDAHYKSMVSWVQDKDVQLCPYCANKFTMINRKHHCRLCGAIMCNKCSQFITFSLAKYLSDPDSFVKASLEENKQIDFKLKRSDSVNSLNSYFFKSSKSSNEPNSSEKTKKNVNLDQIYLRLCVDCCIVLERKFKIQKDKMIKPVFVNIYDELHSYIVESKRLNPDYTKMAESLFSGEAIYQLSNAETMRHKLIKIFQKIDTLSATILKFGIDEELSADAANSKEEGSSLKSAKKINAEQLKLQRNIRLYSINFLKEHSFTLSQLPSAEEYNELKAKRQLHLLAELKRKEVEQNLLKEKLNDQVAKKQQKMKKTHPSITIDNSNGWIPSVDRVRFENSDNEENHESRNETEEERNLKLQINLVNGYLRDALRQDRIDEAKSLKENLNELNVRLKAKQKK